MYLDINQFRAQISEEIENCKYDDLQKKYGINRYYLWHIINDEKYEPPAWVYVHLNIPKYKPAPICTACGSVHSYDRACEMVVTVKPKREKKEPKQKKRYPRFTAYWFEKGW